MAALSASSARWVASRYYCASLSPETASHFSGGSLSPTGAQARSAGVTGGVIEHGSRCAPKMGAQSVCAVQLDQLQLLVAESDVCKREKRDLGGQHRRISGSRLGALCDRRDTSGRGSRVCGGTLGPRRRRGGATRAVTAALLIPNLHNEPRQSEYEPQQQDDCRNRPRPGGPAAGRRVGEDPAAGRYDAVILAARHREFTDMWPWPVLPSANPDTIRASLYRIS